MTRLETAQARSAENGVGGQDLDNSDLAQRHAQLKTAAAEALAGIDAILTGKR